MPATATDRLNGLTTSVAVKAPCRTVATSNITLSGLQTISGYTTVEGDRVLVIGQTAGADNGIYIASTSDWNRAEDFDGARDAVQGTRVIVRSTSADGLEYELTTANPITIGTTALTFRLRYGANAVFSQTAAELAVPITPADTGKIPSELSRYTSITDAQRVSVGLDIALNSTCDSKINGVVVGAGNNTGDTHGTALGASALQSTSAAAEDNTAIGYHAMTNYAGVRSTAVGSQAMAAATSAYQTTAVGCTALYSLVDGGYNTAVGCRTMYSCTVGRENTACGETALYTMVDGVENVAVGVEALYWNVSGSDNAALGYSALTKNTASQNTGVGAFAGANVTTAVEQTHVGYSAGSLNVTGDKMTAVGFEALLQATGADNTAVGSRACRAATTATENTAIGVRALGDITSGTQNSAIGVDALAGVTSHTNCTGLGYHAPVTGSNQVQLGNSATTTYAYGAVQNRSDARDKTDVRDTALGLDFILALHPVDFRWNYREDYGKDANDGSKKRTRFHHGLLAQEVKAVCDSMGVDFGGYQDHSIKGGDDVLSIGYCELVPLLIRAVQQQQVMIQELQASRV